MDRFIYKYKSLSKGKKTLVVIALVIFFSMVLGLAFGTDTTETSSTDTTEASSVTELAEQNSTIEESASESTTQKEVTTKESTTNAPDISMGKKNALRSAQSYLQFSAFSYKGLIEQLEYEGYSKEDATYAVDNCGADWFAQAKKSAESYISISSFSKSGLIDQLEYEGFTHEQAVYGAEAVGY